MPSRWFVEIPRLDPTRVRLEFVHAAFSAWFDADDDAHGANDKPYVISPPTTYGGCVGVQIATLTDAAEASLSGIFGERREVRLGNQTRRVGKAHLLRSQSWESLAAGPFERMWKLEFMTPTTFRSGDRSTPYPQVHTILGGLRRAWHCFATAPLPEDDGGAGVGGRGEGVWVSDLDLRSEVLRMRIGGRDGSGREVIVSGVLGSMTLRSDDSASSALVAPLLRSAPYVGVGSFRGRGLGVVAVMSSRPDDASRRAPAKSARSSQPAST